MGFKIGYIRVSPVDRNSDRQLGSVKVNQTFIENASGKDSGRPELKRMLASVRPGDTVVVHSMDRLARSTTDLLAIVTALADKNVSIQFITEGLTFSGGDSAVNRSMLALLSGLARFERVIVKERQREGIAMARSKGAYRNHGRKQVIPDETISEIRRRVAAGEQKARIARDMKVSRDTLYRYVNAE